MEAPPIFEGENYRGTQQVLGYREIVLQQVRKITTIYSRELTSGFYKKTQPNESGKQEIVAYIPDGRESYINAVEVLYDLLLPKFDDEMKEDNKKLQKDIEDGYSKIQENQKKEGTGLREEWLIKKVKLMRIVFQKLCFLLERVGWLSETSEED